MNKKKKEHKCGEQKRSELCGAEDKTHRAEKREVDY